MELRQVLREKGLSQVNTGGKGLGRIRLKCVHHLCGGKILTFSKEFYSLGKKRFEGLKGEIVMLEFRKKNILCFHWNNHRTSI